MDFFTPRDFSLASTSSSVMGFGGGLRPCKADKKGMQGLVNITDKGTRAPETTRQWYAVHADMTPVGTHQNVTCFIWG